MGMMARMRSLAPWFILLVGGLFVLFMVISDSGALEYFGQQAQNVGSIDGEEVSYQEYSTLVDRARQQQEQATQTSIDESQMDFFRDQVWDALITKKLLEKKIKQYGIVVTDEEIRNYILGPNPPMFLRQQFTDSLGNFNRQLYDQTLLDPRNKEIMVGVEDQIKEQITQEKLENIITASITVSEQEVKDKFVMQNTKMRANYIMIDPNTFLENEIKVEDADLKKYYEKHMEEYKIEPSRVLKYVLFRRLPSTADSVGIQKNLEALVAKMKTDTASFKSYVDIYSEDPYSKDTLAISALDNQARDLLSKANVGDIVGPALTNEGYVVYKLSAKTKSKNEMVRASHILVRSTGNDEADKKKADEIYNELIKGADFGSVAALKSDDGTRSNGGDLGWFGKNQMVKEFEDACYNGKVGVIQKPIKTTFGYHVIKVTGKSNDSYVVEKIVNKIQVSGSTIDKLYQDAEDFSYVAKENGFESEAKLLKYDVIETPPITETSQSIPGLGMGTALVKWSFDNGVGEISDVFRVSAGYAVVMVSDAIKAGFKKFEDVQALVKNSVIREKRFEKALTVAKDIRSKVGDNGDKNIAKSIYAMSRVDSTAEFTTLGNVPGLGRDFGFTEYAAKGDLKKWSQPVKGTLGVYLINVTYRTIFDNSVFEAQKTAIRKDLIQQKRNRYFNQWVMDLKKEGKIVDNRYLFFR